MFFRLGMAKDCSGDGDGGEQACAEDCGRATPGGEKVARAWAYPPHHAVPRADLEEVTAELPA